MLQPILEDIKVNKILRYATLVATVLLMSGCSLSKDEAVVSYDEILEDASSIAVERVTLCLDDVNFYNIEIPVGTEYATDFSKYVYGENPSFTVQVMSNVTDTNFSNSVAIDNPVTVNKNIIMSEPGSDIESAAILLNGNKAVIVRSYESHELYCAILAGFIKDGNNTYEGYSPTYAEDINTLGSFSYNGSYEPSVINKSEVGNSMLFKFEDGCMAINVSLSRYSDVKELYLKRLSTISKSSISTLYEDSDFFYAQAGEFELGIYKQNLNTQIVVFGKGEEAKCNLFYVLKQYVE